MKNCEVCNKEIPEEFENLLCLECYDKEIKENELRNKDEEQLKSDHDAINDFGITDPAYKANPEMEDKEQWQSNILQFSETKILLWKATRLMYEFIKTYCLDKVTSHPQAGDPKKPKFIWKPNIVDVGCGMGVGSNVMSQEANFVWGIDKNKGSIQFAQQAFSRVKNGIYYSSQVTFDQIDILKDTREFEKFDIVVAIEIIEHIYDTHLFLKTIIDKFTKRDKKGKYMTENPTEFFISTPNRNNKHIQDASPKSPYHVREWTQEEFVALLNEYFQKVEILNADGKPVGEVKDHTPILAHCSLPK